MKGKETSKYPYQPLILPLICVIFWGQWRWMPVTRTSQTTAKSCHSSIAGSTSSKQASGHPQPSSLYLAMLLQNSTYLRKVEKMPGKWLSCWLVVFFCGEQTACSGCAAPRPEAKGEQIAMESKAAWSSSEKMLFHDRQPDAKTVRGRVCWELTNGVSWSRKCCRKPRMRGAI